MEEKELWELCDRNRTPLGRVAVRGKTLPPDTYHLVVEVWTVDGRGHILLTLRSPQKETYPGLWECTGGSALAGEDSRRAALRELEEETGIRASGEELTLLGTQWGKRAFFDTYLLVRDLPLEALTLQDGETADARWVTPEELDGMIAQGQVAEPIARRLRPYRERIGQWAAEGHGFKA